MDCHVAPLQPKKRGMKRRREKLNDGDGVVIQQHSKRPHKGRGTEVGREATGIKHAYGGGLRGGGGRNILIESGVWSLEGFTEALGKND